MAIGDKATPDQINDAFELGWAAAAKDGSDDPGQHYIDVSNVMMVHAFRSGWCAEKITVAKSNKAINASNS